jgi:hypothetical protein
MSSAAATGIRMTSVRWWIAMRGSRHSRPPKHIPRAVANQDWTEMRKFVPDYDVDSDQRRAAEAKKARVDARNFTPVTEVLEQLWSPEQSSWLVKCRMAPVKKWNLALKKDAKTGRWRVDGGL